MSASTPAIVHLDFQRTAVIRLTIPRADIGKAMGPAIAELMAAVKQQGIGPAGPVFSHHFAMHPDSFEFEVGVPVSAPLSPIGRVTAGSLPAGTVAHAVHEGPYEELGAAWGRLLEWVGAQKLDAADDLWEVYLAGPETGADARAWRTALNKPLRAQADN